MSKLISSLGFFSIVVIVTLISETGTSMGTRPGTPNPPPPSSPSGFNGPVWLTSNVGAPDMLSLFSEPHLWPNARQRVKVIQFYSQALLHDAHPCASCGENVLSRFKEVQAFERLKEWNIDISVETGAVKDWDCTGQANIDVTRRVFETLTSVSGQVKYIAMDEPFVSGLSLCQGRSGEQVADDTARYMRASYENARKYPSSQSVAIGLIEAYPHFSAEQIVWFLQLLSERGTTPAFLHLDFDHWLARNKGISEAQLSHDLKRIHQKCREFGVKFGMIYWGHDGDNPTNFKNDVTELAQKVRRTLGAPDVAIVQSWAQTKSGKNLNPPNLTESNPTSLTGLILSLAGTW